jgi:membrane protein
MKSVKILKNLLSLIRKSFSSWRDNNAIILAAALSYYALFSLAPILLIIILIAGTILGEQTVKSEIISEVQNIFGEKSAETVSKMIEKNRQPDKGYVATVISIIVLFFASTNLFKNLKKILNIIWDVSSTSRHWIFRQIFDRLLSFLMVLIFGFFFLVTFIIDTGLIGFGEFVRPILPQFAFTYLLETANFLFSVLFMSIIFAIIFKMLPETNVAWKDVFLGAVLTAILFSIGKMLIGFYLGRSRIDTIFGGASSLIVILIWVYYSAQLMFFGAEVTRNYAFQFGSHKENCGERD